MKKKIDFLSRHAFILFLAVVIVLYSLFQARFLILGPRIKVNDPKDGALVHESIIVAEGVAKNASWITLNGRQIFTNKEGVWSEKLILSQGLSIMTIKARDRFGRETEKQIRVFLN